MLTTFPGGDGIETLREKKKKKLEIGAGKSVKWADMLAAALSTVVQYQQWLVTIPYN